MQEIYVDLGSRSYTIYIEKGLRSRLVELIRPFMRGNRIFILTDENVDSYYGEQLVHELSSEFLVQKKVLPVGERSKDFSKMQSIFEDLLAFGLTRTDLILSFGGGVIGDIAGFIASSYLRGVDFIQIPTTLLAQVDASIGGKVGVDLPQGKNVIGAFYQPKSVFIDPEMLQTLPDLFFYDGMAEVVKYGCIKDSSLFSLLEALDNRQAVMEQIEGIIYRCCDLKRQVIERDEYDTGERLLLNYGHTLGHALEAATHYQQYLHGQAISIGMVAINHLSLMQGLLSKEEAERIERLLVKFHLPIQVELSTLQTAFPFLAADKKNLDNFLHVVLLRQIGNAFTVRTQIDFFAPLIHDKKNETS